MKVKVKCSYVINVEVPESMRDHIHFYIEENHCPGTVEMGNEIERIMAEQKEKSCCWACAINGECEILEIESPAPAKKSNEPS